MIVIAGEALIDLVDQGNQTYQAIPGGSPYNCAMAIGRLGGTVSFASHFSSDHFGDQLVKHLQHSQVTLLSPERVHLPSTLAVVSFDDTMQPHYGFYLQGTASLQVDAAQVIARLPPSINIFQASSLALVNPDHYQNWYQVAVAAKQRGALIATDPNCRPAMVTDPDDYRARMADFFQLVDVVKLSDEDLAFLHPGQDPVECIHDLQENSHLSLVVLTQGGDGTYARTAQGVEVNVEATLPGKLVDSVGAGDSFQGALLFKLNDMGCQTEEQVASLSQLQLTELLQFASRVAGINCTRSGCQPPWSDELI